MECGDFWVLDLGVAVGAIQEKALLALSDGSPRSIRSEQLLCSMVRCKAKTAANTCKVMTAIGHLTGDHGSPIVAGGLVADTIFDLPVTAASRSGGFPKGCGVFRPSL